MGDFEDFKTEYIREFTWKTPQKNEIDVAKLIIDHFQGKRVQPLPMQYDSEYKIQFGYKGIPEVQQKHVDKPKIDTTSQASQTVDKNVNFDEGSRLTSPVKQAWGEKSEQSRVVSPAKEGISPIKADHGRPVSPNKLAGRASPTKIPVRCTSPAVSTTLGKDGIEDKKEAVIDKDTTETSPKVAVQSTENKSQDSVIYESHKELVHRTISPKYEKPLMSASLGAGNTNPTVPQNYLKTFNVKAPPSQVYAHTKERGLRIREFDENELRPVTKKPPANIPDPKVTLEQYLNARDLVKAIQVRYKTEYQRQFINWNLPFAKIKEQLEQQMPIDKHRELKPVQLDHAVPTTKLVNSIPKPPTVVESKKKKRSEKEPLDFTKVQSIYHNLTKPAAGTESSDIKDHEKRHYSMEGKTWGLANELFERASSRASNK